MSCDPPQENALQALATRAASTAQLKNPGRRVSAVLVDIIGELMKLSARFDALDAYIRRGEGAVEEQQFREYEAELPSALVCAGSTESPAPAALPSEPLQPAPLPVVDVDEPPPAEAAPAADGGLCQQDVKKTDPAEAVLELTERFASLSRKTATIYAEEIRKNKSQSQGT